MGGAVQPVLSMERGTLNGDDDDDDDDEWLHLPWPLNMEIMNDPLVVQTFYKLLLGFTH